MDDKASLKDLAESINDFSIDLTDSLENIKRELEQISYELRCLNAIYFKKSKERKEDYEELI